MRTPKLDYAKYTKTTLDIDDSLIAKVLENSKGQPTMSDEDVKLAILSLFMTCKRQQEIIDELVPVVNDLRTPKPKKKLRFRKK